MKGKTQRWIVLLFDLKTLSFIWIMGGDGVLFFENVVDSNILSLEIVTQHLNLWGEKIPVKVTPNKMCITGQLMAPILKMLRCNKMSSLLPD